MGQLQSSVDNFTCVEACNKNEFYHRTDTGARCLKECPWIISDDETQKHGGVKLCTTRCEGTYDFVSLGNNETRCVSKCS